MISENKKVRNLISGVALMALALLLFTPRPLKAVESGQLSKKELKSLIKTAKTSAEHLRVASYYRSEATNLRARAAEHVAMIAENHPMNASKVWAARGINHCEYWVKEYTWEAEKADANAVKHERMAAEAAPRASLTFAAMGK